MQVPLRHGLPLQLTRLFGREREMAAVARLLETSRLVTITGPGGIGKTRLALAVAHTLEAGFAHGAAFVSLAAVQEAATAVPAIAQSLHLSLGGAGETRDAKNQLLDYLSGKKLLLLLDNLEQLDGGPSLAADLLQAAPGVKLLVTSRTRLRLQEEQLLPLHGLPVAQWGTVSEAGDNPAVQLFLFHARRLRPSFVLQPEDLKPLAQLCRLVGGMPLALILAASWIEVMSVAGIAREIANSLDFLDASYHGLPERHKSMRAVWRSTWQQLSPRERASFAALSIFRGGFTLPAARSVGGVSAQELRQLVERSLLAPAEGSRFETHELLRQFAAEQLALSPDRHAEVRARHTLFYVDRLRECEQALRGASATATLRALAPDSENIYAAWDWAVTEQRYSSLGTAVFGLVQLAIYGGHYEAAVAALRRAVSALQTAISTLPTAGAAQLLALAQLLAWQCALQYEVGAFDDAARSASESLALLGRDELNQADTRSARALALLRLAELYGWQDRLPEAETMLRESVALSRAVNDFWLMAGAIYYLGGVALKQAKFGETVRHLQEAKSIYEELGDERGVAWAETALGYGGLGFMGRFDEALQALQHSIRTFQTIGDGAAAASALALSAEVMTYAGEFAEAQAVAAKSLHHNELLGRNYWAAVCEINWCRAALHLGHYQIVIDRIPDLLAESRQAFGPMVLASGQFVAGAAFLAQGELDAAARQLGDAAGALRQIGSYDYLCHTLSALVCAHARAGNLDDAREALREAAAIAVELQSDLFLAPLLAAAACLYAMQEEWERAVELYTLAAGEPIVANSRWFADVAGRQAEVPEPGRASEQVAAGEPGQAGDLLPAATALLAAISA
jgi:predicted ATPase